MQDSETSSIVANPDKGKSKKGIILGIIAVLVLVAGVGVGIYLVQQNQEIRDQAAKYNICTPDKCAECILKARPDILPFYEDNGWGTGCNNQVRIVSNWCGPTVDPNACSALKSGQCASSCTAASAATATPAPTATTTAAAATTTPTATSSSTNAPTATPTPTATSSTRTMTPTPTATNRVSVVTTDQEIPQTGTGTPVIIGIGAGLLLLIGAVVLAL